MEKEESNKIENISEKEQVNETGPISNFLTNEGLEHTNSAPDHIGIEIINLAPSKLIDVVLKLKEIGFNYLQCQGGYDEGPGANLVSFYHLISIEDYFKSKQPREVRLKVFLDRNGDLTVPSLYKIFRGSDWQERETFDMFGIIYDGHPRLKRLLMPEDWKGWPLRKDYIQPDFYEMQDAY
ncbi:NAD(P)H-quinone oxidoreductase subunit J [Prochlorococcus marinus]|uniref:NAD(P)H-quinone oxidoreductase subunit J n=1 Tax=Prochlorococcus marinus TaxID=1219 RepID=UPI0022B5DE2E|nr:NAD(P)H-quinone oxidoreductase subunit J [Prochlorococcus marinus]